MTTPSPLELVYSTVDGLDISLDVFLPDNATETAQVPVLIWWHGRSAIVSIGVAEWNIPSRWWLVARDA
jgi:hypothetical protein